MKHDYGCGNSLRRWVVAAALALLSLSAAAQTKLNQTTLGAGLNIGSGSVPGTYQLSVPTGGNASISSYPSAGQSSPVYKWDASSSGPNSGTIKIATNADVPVPGGKVAVKATQTIPKAAVGKALRKFAAKALPLVSTISAIADLLQDLKLFPPPEGNPEGQWQQETDTAQLVCSNQPTPSFIAQNCPSGASCTLKTSYPNGQVAGTGCLWYNEYTNSLGAVLGVALQAGTLSIVPGSNRRPVTDEEMDQKLASAPDAKIIPATDGLLKNGGEVETPNPLQLSGPGTNTTPGGTTTLPNGDKQVTTNNQNITYNGNTYNVQNNTTIKIINAAGDVTSTTVNEAPAPPPKTEVEMKDPCTDNPTRLGCIDAGEPPSAEKLPARNEAVTITPVPFQTNATCPDGVPIDYTILGHAYHHVLAYTPMCDASTNYIRPVMLILAALIAAWVFVGGLKT